MAKSGVPAKKKLKAFFKGGGKAVHKLKEKARAAGGYPALKKQKAEDKAAKIKSGVPTGKKLKAFLKGGVTGVKKLKKEARDAGGYETLKKNKAEAKAKAAAEAAKNRRVKLHTPLQEQLIDRLAQLGMQGTNELYPRLMADPNQSFEPIAKAARQGFSQQTVPTLAERFTNMNAGAPASGFMNIMGAAGQNLETDLAAQRAQYGQQMIGNQGNFLTQILGQALQPQFEPMYQSRGPNGWMQAAGALASSLPSFLPKPGGK